MATKPSKKQVAPAAEAPQTAVSTQAADMGTMILVGDKHDLSHIKTGAARGSENVGTDDLVIPRLEVVQGLSGALKSGTPDYIEGAKQGDIINSVTKQNYGKEVFVVRVHYTKQWLVWKLYSEGGGFFGAFANPELAKERLEQAVTEGEKRDFLEVIDTPQHLCLLVDMANRRIDEVMLALAKTKAKVSRAWNTMIRLTGKDGFAMVYRVTTALEKNKKNQEFWNFVIAGAGFAAKPLYARAEQLFEQINAGQRTVVMDTKGFQASGEGHVEDGGDDETPM